MGGVFIQPHSQAFLSLVPRPPPAFYEFMKKSGIKARDEARLFVLQTTKAEGSV